jgi:hypothetical protein
VLCNRFKVKPGSIHDSVCLCMTRPLSSIRLRYEHLLSVQHPCYPCYLCQFEIENIICNQNESIVY